MTVHRFAISFDEKLARAVREAAGDQPISTWLAQAAQRRLRAEGLADVVREWEEGHRELTTAELRSAAASLRGRRRKSK
jgi:hypothetical protein